MVNARGEPVRRHTGVLGVIACERDGLRKRERPSVTKRAGGHKILEILLDDIFLDQVDALGIVRVAHQFNRQIRSAGNEITSDVD